MTKEQELVELAGLLEACAEDAKRPVPYRGTFPELQGVYQEQPASIISLANGLLAIAAALRARSAGDGE